MPDSMVCSNKYIMDQLLKNTADAMSSLHRADMSTKLIRALDVWRVAVCFCIVLELRRLHTDLIYCYKIVFGLTDLPPSDYFQMAPLLNTKGINLSYTRSGVLPSYAASS